LSVCNYSVHSLFYLFQYRLVLVFSKVYRETVWCWFIEKMDAKSFMDNTYFMLVIFRPIPQLFDMR